MRKPGKIPHMPRYMIAPAVLVFTLCAILVALFALPSSAEAANATQQHVDALLRLFSGSV